jgi:predicted transposase YdaD
VEFNPYDVSTKELVWDGPAAWLIRLRIALPGPVDVIDSDITALTAAADKVIQVGGPEPFLVNLEFQSSHKSDLIQTLWFRQAALYHRHRLPVLTVLMLLRREANSPSFKGTFKILMPDGFRTNLYNYRIVRVWKDDPESYLTAGVNLVPLAPLANVPAQALPGMVRRMAARINAEPEPRASMLWTATYLLMGLRYSEAVALQLLEGVQNMRESTTYQAILREGRNEGLIEGAVRELQRVLLIQGEIRFGAPNERIRNAIEEIRDLEHLERMSRRLLDTNLHDWEGLLDTP